MKYFVLSLLLIFSSGCSLKETLDKFIDQIDKSTKDFTNEIDNAVYSLDQNSISWQGALKQLEEKMSDDMRELVQNDLKNLADGTIRTTGSEFRCNSYYMKYFVRNSLVNLKNKLLRKKDVPELPCLCSSIPQTLDYERVMENKTKTLALYGFNLSDPKNIKMEVLEKDSSVVQIPSELISSFDSYIVVDLSRDNIYLDNAKTSIQIKNYDDVIIGKVPITGKRTPVCKDSIVDFQANPLHFIPIAVTKDTEFAGNGPKVTAHASLENQGDRLVLRYSMVAREEISQSVGGYTEANQSASANFFVAPEGWEIIRVEGLSGLNSDYYYIDSDVNDDVFEVGNNGIVRKFRFIGDTHGADAGVNTSMHMEFHRCKIVLRQTTNCLTII